MIIIFIQAIKNGDDLEPYRIKIHNHIRDVVKHYKGKMKNYKVFNEVMHGELYRKNFPGIWDEVFEIIKKEDPEAQMMFNDYQESY